MSGHVSTVEPFSQGSDLITALAPEFVLIIGLFTLMIVPNMGDATFRIPLTQVRLPWFFGGKRRNLESDPRLPGLLATVFFSIAFLLCGVSFVNGMARTEIVTPGGTPMLKVDEFSRMFELIFFGALALASAASVNRFPATSRADRSPNGLYNNRRQIDFYILLITTGLGMSIVALAQDLFMLFIGLELASFSTYVLVAFIKESREGTEAGMKYFIVGSVASGVGLYGLSLLYLWSGSLQFADLSVAFAENGLEPLPLIALGLLLVGFGFKVSAAPFHFAAPDAYAGAAAPIAGVLATASKAMGVLGLLRILLVVASPEATDGSAVWLIALGVLSVITMTWGNLAALGSTNPKRMLAYSSVAHAGYMLAAITAIGALNWESGYVDSSNDAALAVVTALVFHLAVLVCFKLGAFPCPLPARAREGRPHPFIAWRPCQTRSLLGRGHVCVHDVACRRPATLRFRLETAGHYGHRQGRSSRRSCHRPELRRHSLGLVPGALDGHQLRHFRVLLPPHRPRHVLP